MGQQVRDLLSLPRPVFLDEPSAAFDSSPRPIDLLFAELSAAVPSRVGRAEALSVAAVQRGRNALCSIATLPLVQYKGLDIVRSPFLEQIDPDVANVVTIAQTIEDLAFDGISWWLITAQDFAGYPVAARHLDVGAVSLDPPEDGRVNPFPSGRDARGVPIVWVHGEPKPADVLIRFDSPNPGLLVANARAIRRALLLDKLASTYADNPRPLDYFTDSDDPTAEPMDDDEVDAFLAEWREIRKRSSTGYIPGALKRVDVDTPSPAELQLVELQRQATLEIANGLGVDPEDLGVSTTSRTYFNAQDRRTTRINETYAPFMEAITQRLSMGDVTRRGHRVAFDLTNYLKPDPVAQTTYWKALKDMGVMDADEIRAAAGLSGPAPKPTSAPAPAAPVDDDQGDEQTEQVAADRPAGMTFADDQGPAMTFAGFDFAGQVDPPKVDVERRTITGLAVPYNKVASKYGLRFRFLPGSLKYADVSRIKHLKDHYTPVGITQSVEETKAGPIVKLSVLGGPEGSVTRAERDQLLYDAEHGLYDGLSIGVDFSMDPKSGDVEWNEKDGVYDVKRADWRETSSTPMPAFDDARVTKVAASRTAQRGRSGMPEENEPTEAQTTPPAAGGIQLDQSQVTALLSRPGALEALIRQPQQSQNQGQPAVPAGGLTLSAEQVDGLIKSGGLGVLLGMPQLTPAARTEQEAERRPTVDPTRRTVAASSVTEPGPYRFDRRGNLTRGTHDFSSDLIAGSKGDGAALARAQDFMAKQFDAVMREFDTDRTDVAALNPNRNRPDLYVDQREYQYPVWSAINKGTLTDGTPFVLPKFNSASGLVAAHTEGVEPTPGTFTATSQTITPTAVSGKVEVTREAWESGGNPQLSTIIWRQMLRAWFEALEASAVTLLDSLTPTGITLTTAAVDDALVSELEAALAALHYTRGGFRMRDFPVQIDLYKALVNATDADGRKLLPVMGPSNASGMTESFFGAVMVGGLRAIPAWALAASGTVAASSYLFDREDVHGWATAPNRLQFEYRVAYVDVAIWGWKATACTDTTGVREVIYDPVA